jgi:putative membrane protein
MGASDVVPGVSGGTMAFILGIYDELIEAIRSFDLRSLRLLVTLRIRPMLEHIAWPFLLALGVGILTAILSFSRLLSWLLENKPIFIWAFFFGLILASVITVSRRVEVWRLSTWLCMGLGSIGAYVLVGLVPLKTPEEPWFLFLCGAVAICAMILPGISGSFVLVLMGKYSYVLTAVNERNLFVLAILSLGACTGIVLFSRLIGWLLKRYHDHMVAILTGLMLGSLRKIWPWKEATQTLTDDKGGLVAVVQSNILPVQWSVEVTLAIIFAFAGFFLVLFLDRLARRQK